MGFKHIIFSLKNVVMDFLKTFLFWWRDLKSILKPSAVPARWQPSLEFWILVVRKQEPGTAYVLHIYITGSLGNSKTGNLTITTFPFLLPPQRRAWIPSRIRKTWHKIHVYLSASRRDSCKCALIYYLQVWRIGVLCVFACACTAMNCLGRASIIYDERLTELRTLTLDGSPAEEAAPGLAARANRVLTGC